MKEKRKRKLRLKDTAVKVAYSIASLEANTACPLIAYQPEQPNELKRLRKF